MRVAIIGRTDTLYDTALHLRSVGHRIVTIVTSKAAPEYGRGAAEFRDLATELGAKFYQTSKINEIPDISADIGVSMNYTGIVPQLLIDRFRYGILNAHGGDLPRYRGNACHGWAILKGEPHTALTIHRMVGGELDSGDIVARERFALGRRTKAADVFSWVHKITPALFARSIEREAAGIPAEKQVGSGRRCYPMLPEDGAIDWTNSAASILRLVNACARPFAGAFCFDEYQKVIIWDADLVDDGEDFLAAPGQVVSVGDGFVDVATGAGKLRILEMSLPFSSVRSIRKRLRNGYQSAPLHPEIHAHARK